MNCVMLSQISARFIAHVILQSPANRNSKMERG